MSDIRARDDTSLAKARGSQKLKPFRAVSKHITLGMFSKDDYQVFYCSVHCKVTISRLKSGRKASVKEKRLPQLAR